MHPIRAFRLRQDPPLSQAAAGRMIGISATYLHRIESGEREVSSELLPVIRERMGIPADALRPDLVEQARAIIGAAQ